MLRQLIASALVALLVSVAVSGATSPPITDHPTHGIGTAVTWRASGPSNSQRLDALSKRIDILTARLADTRQIAQNAAKLASCVDGGFWVTQDDETGDWMSGDGTESDAVVMATLAKSCAVAP